MARIIILRSGANRYEQPSTKVFKLILNQPTVDMNELLFNGKTIKSDLSYSRGDYNAVITAIDEGRISLQELEYFVTARIDMKDLEEKGIKELINFKDKHIKILVRVDPAQPMTGALRK